jgi:serine/threonine protein kinase
MKVMNKNYIIQKKYLHYVVGEFEIMKMLSGFPFVIDLHYCFQTANYLYMIIDICPGGDFADLKYVNNMKLFLAEVILAFEHIHNHHVVYRDLKPENILLDTTGHIKICDFNLAKANISKQKKATSFCGSPMYLSPEMLDPEGVDQRADIYGIGLLIYELICDRPAYKADNLNQLYEKIKANQIDFNNPKLEGDIKDLLQKILVADPEKRISIEEIKRHPYFKDISFLKVYKKEYGPIEIKKKDASEIDEKDKIFSKNILEGKTEEERQKEKQEEEKKSEDKFKEEQKKLDANKEYSFLDGKITVREMKKDQKRAMKNYVREFYYVKKEDTPQTEEFQLTVNGILNTNDI